jgi:fumarylacetoacetase
MSVAVDVGANRTKSALISRSNLKHLHWSPFQMLAHHTSAGCGLGSGDLLGTGTLSSSEMQAQEAAEEGRRGAEVGRLGCLHELTEGGRKPVDLQQDFTLTWLEDGDEIIMEGWAGQGSAKIGFGEVRGKILPAEYREAA